MKKQSIRVTLLDHVCRECGGRIGQLTSHGPTGGGNPVYRCTQCGKSTSAMGPSCLCWCGFAMRGQQEGAYQCAHFDITKEDPRYIELFRRCGCDPFHKAEVGILLTDDLYKLRNMPDATLNQLKK